MLHLDRERLAALADSDPTTDEAAHLSACAECARELAAHRAVLALAAAWRAEGGAGTLAPLVPWESLAEELNDEGLVKNGKGRGTRPGAGRLWLRVAAAIVLAAGGALVGRLSATGFPHIGSDVSVAQSDAAKRGASGDDTGLVRPVSSTVDSAPAIHSLADALATIDRAQRDYRVAAAFIAQQDSSSHRSSDPDRYRVRLAALDQISTAALAARTEAPQDPVISQYYQATLTARQLTLSQLQNTLPTGVRLAGF